MTHRLLRSAARVILALLVRARCYPILVRLVCRQMREHTPEGLRPVDTVDPDRIKILAIHPKLFRGDLQILAGCAELQVLQVPVTWQSLLVRPHYPQEAGAHYPWDAPEESPLGQARSRCRTFMRGFLERLYRHVPVDCVVSANVRFLTDVDWATVSEQLDVPWVVLYREGLFMTQFTYDVVVERHRRYGKFTGSHIIVHNQVARRSYLESGFVEADQVSAGGILRMDSFLQRLRERDADAPPGQKAALFFFGHDHYLLEHPGCESIYADTIIAFAGLATRHPEIGFVIKPKAKFGYGEQRQHLEQTLSQAGLAVEQIPNLTIEPEADVHDLILECRLVCGLLSTTLLEAAVAGKPVILPFYEKLRTAARDDLPLADHLHLFDVADDRDSLERLLEARLVDSTVSPQTQRARDALFGEWVSPIEGQATPSYVRTLTEIVAPRRGQKRLSS